jgi:predicted enzyme involved in methoxymalonyl-ACP biosynthesis
MSVSDKYGEMGLTGVFIARLEDGVAIVDTLLLSCRVLGRRLEFAFVDQCMRLADKLWRPAGWRAEYISTNKNDQVRAFWSDAGFDLEYDDQGRRQYRARAPVTRTDYVATMTVLLE